MEAGPTLGAVVQGSSTTALCALGSPVFIQREEGYDLLRHCACNGDSYRDHQFQHLFLFLLSLYLKPLGGGGWGGRCPVKVVLWQRSPEIVIFSKGTHPRCGGGSLPSPLFPESVYPSVRHIPGNQRTFVDSETD